jgi:trehalose 6-phosphate phosphatase
MKHLFTPEGEAALAAALARQPLLAFDFDGTLAAIVARPEDARVPVAVVRRLEQLSRLLPLAIITGRSVDDVSERLDFRPRFIVGNHGAEGPCREAPGDWAVLLQPLRDRLRMRADELAAIGVAVEDKQYSVAMHYRLARDRGSAFGLITRLVANLGPGLKVFGGKLVVNVSAAQAPDKAQALADLVRRCEARGAVYVGDDVNDEPVFERREPSWLTVRVGRDNPNTEAMFVLEHPGEIAMLLERLLRLLHKPPD